MRRHRWLRLPIIRGVVALSSRSRSGSGARHLGQRPAPEEPEEEIAGRTWGFTIFLSLAFAVGLFFVAPVTLANFWKDELGNSVAFVAAREADPHRDLPRLPVGISRIPDLRRVFEYHGAEHKAISCYEAGEPLDARERAAPLPLAPALRDELPADRDDHRRLRLRADRPPGAALADPLSHPGDLRSSPGIAYEIIRWAGRNRHKRWVRGLMWPGLQLQQPDDPRAVARPARGLHRRAERRARGRGPLRVQRGGPGRHGSRRLPSRGSMAVRRHR